MNKIEELELWTSILKKNFKADFSGNSLFILYDNHLDAMVKLIEEIKNEHP